MRTLLVVCQHGNEKSPLEVISKNFQGVEYLVANSKAYDQDVRFIETDLNRSFPGSKNGKYEERLADKLLSELENYKFILDFHTATCETPIFSILTKTTPEHIKLAKSTGAKRLVYMEKSIASGKALIDFVKVGISLECGLEGDIKTKSRIKRTVGYYLKGKKFRTNYQYYIVFDILKMKNEAERLTENIKCFKFVSKGEVVSEIKGKYYQARQSFYPILARETNYKGVLCLMARRVSEEQFIC